MEEKWILPFKSNKATLATSGGKGANLARLARADFPVPPGFLVTTDAYRRFVEANGLLPHIAEILSATAFDQPASLQESSRRIRAAFSAGSLPAELDRALRREYRRFATANGESVEGPKPQPVAVRSSATAEDLPELSFAGQQDTYLNVIGEEAFLSAVVACWSSLWTARAIGYRARNEIPQKRIALAVVVQQMIPCDVSGVLFTANALNGKRTEMVIDATWGLGEALVSGLVEPDHYVVEAATGRIIEQRLGTKATVIRPRRGGGTERIGQESAPRTTLSPEDVRSLVALGRRVAEYYGTPQDVEWGRAQGRLYLLQSRPITSLYPLLERVRLPPADPLQVFLSFSAVQGMLDPMTPLGRDFMKSVFAGAAGLFGYELSTGTQRVLYEAGGRLYINVTTVMRHPVGRRLLKGALPMVEPGAAQAIHSLSQDPRLAPSPHWFRWRTVWRIARAFAPVFRRFVSTMRHPHDASRQVQARSEQLLSDFAQRSSSARSLQARVGLLEHLASHFAGEVILALLPVIAAGMASLNLLNRLALSAPGRHNALELTRGLPNNVTTQMDLSLWAAAQRIRASEAAAERFAREEASELKADFLAGRLPPPAQKTLEEFLGEYGMRGVGEIDVGRPRWAEDPTPVILTLKSFLQIEDPQRAPDAVFHGGATRAGEARQELAGALRRTPGGRLKVRLMQIAADRVRALSGLRESPKFLAIRLMGIVRKELLQSGEELANEGTLHKANDVFFLRLDELKALAGGVDRKWHDLVAERREVYAREKKRQQVPRIMLSDGQAFYKGMVNEGDEQDGALLTGSPVSPGTVEGLVRVIFDPHSAQLAPGEILVCPGTDPAWTPLFLAAGGLVMEVGGLMTHGSVVAREYGIPAVVGVHRATERLQTGQRVRVDGTAGRVRILDRPSASPDSKGKEPQ